MERKRMAEAELGSDNFQVLPESGKNRLEEHEVKIQKLEQHRLSKTVVVPTAERDVIHFLRLLKEPKTLFGEGKLDRRERLRNLLVNLSQSEIERLQLDTENVPEGYIVQEKPQGIFFTEGPEELKEFRLKVSKYSLYCARERIFRAKNEQVKCVDTDLVESVNCIVNQASEVADTRPVVSCCFSPHDEFIATASWSGHAKIWNPDLTVKNSFLAHDDRLTSIVWHPKFDASASEGGVVQLATGAVDATARLWTVQGTHISTLRGHTQRLARIAMHPMGLHLGTCSFDRTWRLWDLTTEKCLLEQEGHSRPVYCLAFQCDGSLAVSGGLDGYARVWDLRTGRSLTLLKGHAKSILAVDFSSNGYMIATGSEDHTCRVYDLRKRETLAVLPGHRSLISQVRFDKNGQNCLLTSGYDNVSKIWCGRRLKLVKTLAGHDGKVMGSDISNHFYKIATVGYDRTIKLWHPDLHE